MILLLLDDSGWFCLVLTDSILQLSLAFSSLAIISHLSFTTFEKETSAHDSSQNDIICFNLRFPFPPRGQVYRRRWAHVALLFAFFASFFAFLFLITFLPHFYQFLDRFWDQKLTKNWSKMMLFFWLLLSPFLYSFFFDFSWPSPWKIIEKCCTVEQNQGISLFLSKLSLEHFFIHFHQFLVPKIDEKSSKNRA